MSETLEVIEPATEAVLASFERAGAEEVDEAVARAAAALPSWRTMTAGRRASLMREIVKVMEDHHEELALLEARNAGKPIASARGEIGMAIETFRYFSGAPERPFGETIPADGGIALTVREPIGVVGLITPWNFPLAIACWKMAPALAAGNTIVLKPAELTPCTSVRFAELALEAGLPAGVLNVVVGPGSTVGSRIVEHPGVGKIAFTGSTEVGAAIAAGAAATIKRVTLELGGKSANIVFADADIDLAARSAPGAVFDNSGQDCCARSRILVERPALDEFLAGLEGAVGEMKVGDPLDETTTMGPLISAAHRDQVASFLADGETVAFAGSAPDGPGFWMAPTVLCPIEPGARAATEEIFGPIAAVIPFDTEEEAIRLANDTIYGLSGSVWTGDGARGLRVARAMESGNLSVNSNSSVRVTTPFGGFKRSGYGRELGPHALDAYTEVKTIYVRTEEE